MVAKIGRGWNLWDTSAFLRVAQALYIHACNSGLSGYFALQQTNIAAFYVLLCDSFDSGPGRLNGLLVLSLTLRHKLLNLSLEELLMQEPIQIIELCQAPFSLNSTFPAGTGSFRSVLCPWQYSRSRAAESPGLY